MVLVEPSKDAESQVEDLLAPYDENMLVKEYEKPCWCIGSEARAFASKMVNKRLGTIDKCREDIKKTIREVAKKEGWKGKYPQYPFGLPSEANKWSSEKKKLWKKIDKITNKIWKKQIDERHKLEQEIYDKHPLKDLPNPKCGFYNKEDLVEKPKLIEKGVKVGDRYLDGSGCGGTGKVMSTYNPNSTWDWWVIGGRWQGHLIPNYDPYKDERNLVKCDLCNGTGERPGWVTHEKDKNGKDVKKFKDKNAERMNGCNGCHGTGKQLSFTLAPCQNEFPVKELLKRKGKDRSNLIPYAIVTPGEGWIAKGQMGWWGMSTGNKKDGKWKKEVLNILNKYKDLNAVVVDCHI